MKVRSFVSAPVSCFCPQVAVLTLVLVGSLMLCSFASCCSRVADKPAGLDFGQCKTDLANRLQLPESDIRLASADPVDWPDSGLGMPELDKAYAAVVSPGHRLMLQARGRVYLYVTDTKSCRYGGPLSVWAYSMLYLQAVENDPNLNSDLYQCSLLGTNSVRLASGVSDYWPQGQGVVVATRRTSRSSHDLFYIQADAPGKETVLYHAFDFGAAALDSARRRWAGFVRQQVGRPWNLAIGRVAEQGKTPRFLPLPDETKPGRIAWAEDSLVILAGEGAEMRAFETDPEDETPTWARVPSYRFPGMRDFVLNRSESLDITAIEEAGKSTAEVAIVWFTGDRNVVWSRTGFRMLGCDFLEPYAFLWGVEESGCAAYTVDIYSGDFVSSHPGEVSNIKPFECSPHSSPLPKTAAND